MPVQIRYVGPYIGVDIYPDPSGYPLTVARGGTVEVSDAAAGAEPSGDDPGSGYLAQPSNWERVTTLTKSATKTEA